MQNIAIFVNGKGQKCPSPLSVQGLIERMALAGKKVAVERNGEIVPRTAHAATLLSEGDRVEIVVAVGGG